MQTLWVFLVSAVTCIAEVLPEVEIDMDGAVYGYRVVDKDTRELLYFIPSSFQTNTFNPNWGRMTAHAAIHYSPDKRSVAITEDNHRCIGNTYILIPGVDGMPALRLLFETDRDDAILKKTGLKWERRRYQFLKWMDSNRAAIELLGYCVVGKTNQNSASFTVVLTTDPFHPIESIKQNNNGR